MDIAQHIRIFDKMPTDDLVEKRKQAISSSLGTESSTRIPRRHEISSVGKCVRSPESFDRASWVSTLAHKVQQCCTEAGNRLHLAARSGVTGWWGNFLRPRTGRIDAARHVIPEHRSGICPKCAAAFSKCSPVSAGDLLLAAFHF